jgi:hypothetical protein
MQTKNIYVDGKLVGSVPVTGDFEADAARALGAAAPPALESEQSRQACV